MVKPEYWDEPWINFTAAQPFLWLLSLACIALGLVLS